MTRTLKNHIKEENAKVKEKIDSYQSQTTARLNDIETIVLKIN